MNRENPYQSAWLAVRNDRSGPLLRIVLSFIAGIFCIALAIGGAWLFVHLIAPRGHSGRFGSGSVRDDDVGVAMFFAAILWLGLLVIIWRGAAARTRWGVLLHPLAIIGTLGLWGATGVACFLADRNFRDEEPLIAVAILIAAGVTLLIWAPLIRMLFVGRRVVTEHDQINVECPRCGYSLVGLSELRCPECGMTFTLDEVIRAQHYDRPRHTQVWLGQDRPQIIDRESGAVP